MTTPKLLGAFAAVALLAACAPAARSSAPDAELRVLVYNIHAGKDAAGQENLARVAAVVRDAGADVVLLQEVDRGTRRSGGVDQVAELARRTGFHAAFGRTLDYDGGAYGIALLSRWPVQHDSLVRLPVQPPQQRAGGAYEPRGALVARVTAPWGALSLVTTHLDASRDDVYRLQEVRTVVAAAGDARAGATLALVGGDFNATPESGVHAALRDAGWRDAWTACGRGDALTYPAGVPVKRIDYLYLPPGATCREARVLAGDASDHRALLVRVARDAAR